MMNRVAALTAKYRHSGILLDTNLFILLAVGSHDPQQIARFKRTKLYTADDFELLVLVLEPFDVVVTTPNLLTEVSNLSGNLGGHFEGRYFAALIERVRLLQEIYIRSIDVMEKPEFLRLGLTDVGLIDSAVGNYLLLTNDLDLYAWAAERGADALLFSQLRTYLLD